MGKRTIRVVVCGDSGVGKTTLIVALIKDKFIANLQDVLPPVTIERDFSSNPYSPQETILIDTNNDDPHMLQAQLKSADVIWMVYSNRESYERISLHWMMFFRSLGLNIPVIVCKNKCDQYKNDNDDGASEEDTRIEDEEFIPLLMEFKEIDTCIKVSALTEYDVNQAFYLCQRAVINPITPLFDSKLGQLKPLAVQALERIFLLCDNDQDGYLSDEEISALQMKCFKKSIDINELAYIKRLLLQANESEEVRRQPGRQYYIEGKGITQAGFLLLNKFYVENGRHETIWAILRSFKYTDSLSLDSNVLHPKLSIPDTSSVELSPRGYRFLIDIFLKFDKDNDGGLSDEELIALFKCTPGLPQLWSATEFPFSTVVNNRACITLQGWLAQWSMTTFLDYKTTTEYLVYFGFEEDTRIALQITKPRKFRRRAGKIYRYKVKDRKVFNCFVFGKKRSGKTSLLESFLGRVFSSLYTPTIKPKIAVNSLELKGGKQYYLILQEFSDADVNRILEDKNKLKHCDVICMTYDSSDPDSFSYSMELYNKYCRYIKDIPVTFVALKADLDRQQQRCDIQPDDFTDQLFIEHPLHVSSRWLSSLNELFIKITEAALTPGDYTPGFPDESKPKESEYMQAAIVLGASVGFITLLTFTVAKLYKTYRH